MMSYFNRLVNACLLLIVSLYTFQSAQAGNVILVQNASFSCDAQISLYFDRVFNATEHGDFYMDLQEIDNSKAVIKKKTDLYDYYYKINTQGKVATITLIGDKGNLIVFDRDLPCRAAVVIVDKNILTTLGEKQLITPTEISKAPEVPTVVVPKIAYKAPVEEQPKISNESNGSNAKVSQVEKAKGVDNSNSMEMQVKASVVASVSEARLKIDEVESRITMLVAILEYTSNASPTRREKITSTIGSEIEKLRKEKAYMQTFYSKRFSTPIRPNNANLKVSAFRAAETFPKIPYYVPGTDEVGEMLVMPQVSDVGALYYSFEFMDPSSSYSKVRDTIKVSHESIDFLISGLAKIDSWTDVAQDNNVNRRVEKTASCIPVNACDDKKAGVSSTEVMFQIYEDGSTAGRIQRNKGLYVVGYNMSVESSILVEAYLRYMKEIGSKEFNVGVMTNEEILDLFE